MNCLTRAINCWHYTPSEPLGRPVQALVGYDIVLGWAVKRAIRRAWGKK